MRICEIPAMTQWGKKEMLLRRIDSLRWHKSMILFFENKNVKIGCVNQN